MQAVLSLEIIKCVRNFFFVTSWTPVYVDNSFHLTPYKNAVNLGLITKYMTTYNSCYPSWLKIRQSSIWYTGSLGSGTKDSSTKRIIFSFTIPCKILFKNYFHLFYYFFIIKIKSFECPKSIRNNEKNNAWNIRRLVAESRRPSQLAYYIVDWRILKSALI